MAAKKIEICRIQSYRGKLLVFCGIAIDIMVWGYGAIFLPDVAYGCLYFCHNTGLWLLRRISSAEHGKSRDGMGFVLRVFRPRLIPKHIWFYSLEHVVPAAKSMAVWPFTSHVVYTNSPSKRIDHLWMIFWVCTTSSPQVRHVAHGAKVRYLC